MRVVESAVARNGEVEGTAEASVAGCEKDTVEASCDSFLEELSWKSTPEMPRLLEPIHSLMGCHQLLSCKSAAGGAASDSDGVAGAVDGVLDGDFAVGARALRPVQEIKIDFIS